MKLREDCYEQKKKIPIFQGVSRFGGPARPRCHYNDFLDQLDLVWKQCYDALVPGGSLVCVVFDVCLSRRKNNLGELGFGRHPTPIALQKPRHDRVKGKDFYITRGKDKCI